jgi:sulfite exporter TauE/SafE
MIPVWLSFIAGLAGSGHCLGMCGGIVAAISVTDRRGGVSGALFMLLYNLGRVTTYAFLGFAAGALGGSLNLLTFRPLSAAILAGANLLVMVAGIGTLFRARRFGISRLESGGAGLLAGAVGRIAACRSAAAGFPLGLLLGLLPCGLVYAPLVAAAGTGDPVVSAGMMAALGAGTVPMLLLFGTLSTLISLRLRDLMLRFAGAAVAVIGAHGLWHLLSKM